MEASEGERANDRAARVYFEALFATVVGRALFFVCAAASLWFATRVMDKETYGTFQVVLQIIILMALPATLGLDTAVLYRLARTEGPHGSLLGGGMVRRAIVLSLATGVAAAVVLMLAADWLERFLGLSGLADILSRMVWAIPPLAVMAIFEAWYRARQRLLQSTIIPVLINLFRAILFGTVFLWSLGATAIVWAEVVAAFLTLLLWFAIAPATLYFEPGKLVGEDFKYGGRLAVSKLIVEAVRRVDLLMLGALSTAAAAADYSVAARLAMMVELAREVLTAAFTPRVGQQLARGHRESVEREYAAVRAPALACAVLASAALVLLGNALLTLFGDFASGYAPLLLLSIGLIADSAFGQNAALLSMAGRANSLVVSRVAMLALLVGVNIALVPTYGAVGAAIGTSAAYVFFNAALYVVLRRVEGLQTVSWRELGLLIGSSGVIAATAFGQVARLPATTLLVVGVLVYGLLEPLTWRPVLQASLSQARRTRNAWHARGSRKN